MGKQYRSKSDLDTRVEALGRFGDVGGMIRLPYNLVVSGDRPYWLAAEEFTPGVFRDVPATLLGAESFDEGYRLPVAMVPYVFGSKRAQLEARSDGADVLSVQGAGLYLPGSRVDKPHGVFVERQPKRWVRAIGLSNDGGSVFFVHSRDGIEDLRSENQQVPKPLRRVLQDASTGRSSSVALERILVGE